MPKSDRRTRRHSDSRWSSWFVPDVHRGSWLGSSSRRPRRDGTGSRRLTATPGRTDDMSTEDREELRRLRRKNRRLREEREILTPLYVKKCFG